jgi:hypothetical protein
MAFSRKSKLVIVAIILVSVIGGTIFAHEYLQSENASILDHLAEQENSRNHFSVVYRGFLPDVINDSFPDYYVCVNDLDADTLEFYILLEVLNQETRGYYFRTEEYEPAPGWTVSQRNMSNLYTVYVGIDRTVRYYAYLTRTKPSSIPEGRLTESVNVAVMAFNDSAYEQFYSQDNFTVTFHFLDRTAPVWTVLYYDNFDDGTNQGWAGVPTTELYRSYRYSITTTGSPWMAAKKLYVPPTYQEAYLIYSRYVEGGWPYLVMNGTFYFYADKSATTGGTPGVTNPAYEWYQFTNPLWVGKTTYVQCYIGRGHIDDVYVIAK